MIVRVRAEPLWKISVRVLADLLILLGVAGVIAWVWGLGEGALYQYSQAVHFESATAAPVSVEPPKGEPAPVPGIAIQRLLAPALPKPDPLLLGRLEIPSIHLRVMVREGADDASLRKAAGHLPSSALPGDMGNVVLLGHRDTFFRPLRGIAQGDPIRVKTRKGQFDYVVDSIQVVDPEQSLAFGDAPSSKSLTLITCFPFDYVGPAPRRFVVRSRMAVPDVERFVQSDKAGDLEKLQ
jgi:sortase A